MFGVGGRGLFSVGGCGLFFCKKRLFLIVIDIYDRFEYFCSRKDGIKKLRLLRRFVFNMVIYW